MDLLAKEFVKEMKAHGYKNTKKYLAEAKLYVEYCEVPRVKQIAEAYVGYRERGGLR